MQSRRRKSKLENFANKESDDESDSMKIKLENEANEDVKAEKE